MASGRPVGQRRRESARLSPPGGRLGARGRGRGRPGARREDRPAPRFFQDPDFEFTFLIALGRAYYSASNVGTLFALAGQTADGDAESAYQAFTRAGDEARTLAEASAQHGHRVSARQAYLWAAGYYHSATYFIDATADPSRFRPIWETHLDV